MTQQPKSPDEAAYHYVRRGAPSTVTEELVATIVNHIRLGSYIETAVASAGVPKPTFYDWMRRAAEDRSKGDDELAPDRRLYRKLSDGVERALADAELRDLNIIGLAATKNWQAAAWRLERRNFERWGRTDRIRLSGDPEGIPIITEVRQVEDLDFTALDEDELQTYIAMTSRMRAAPGEPPNE